MLQRQRNSHRRFRYSLEYKKKVLQSIHSIGVAKTCRKMDVKKEQVQYWLTREQEILNASPEDSASRFRLSKTMYGEVAQEEHQIFEWLTEKKRHKETVRNDEILERAAILFIGVPNSKTKASRKWLVSFKKRFGLIRADKVKSEESGEMKGEDMEETKAEVKAEVKEEGRAVKWEPREVIDLDEMVIL